MNLYGVSANSRASLLITYSRTSFQFLFDRDIETSVSNGTSEKFKNKKIVIIILLFKLFESRSLDDYLPLFYEENQGEGKVRCHYFVRMIYAIWTKQ